MDIVKKFGRILLPMITPFNEDFSVNYEIARKVASYLVEKNYCDTLIVAGTTGEFHSISFEERVKLFEEIKDEVGDKVPLIAGTGAVTTKETIELTKEAEKLGYDAAMIVVPYYCHPTQEGIYQHFKEIAKKTSLPLIIYNIPLFVNMSIAPETVGRLSEIDNIVAVKDEAGLNPLQTSEFIKKSKGRLSVYSGDDVMVLQVLSQGGVGVVSGGAHVVGDIIRDMIDSFLTGKTERSIKLFQLLYDVFKSFFGISDTRVNPTPGVKMALEIESGLPVSRTRLPLLTYSEEDRNFIKEILEKARKAYSELE
ncbi:4-hydroxy-tetrahydrodipicolinate synthase [Thermosipho atlanticus]|uniref:4-hydroxy-tetrahydrodipicolinate synthase n=1 Tax=Thermosipho atlanticus DSM 15807 TaxID=1123380 RepID=A0A1M5TVT1_9BACT|nr:4-hydroxy-tetrahydrodipicolinate synthase [Thermosipho atlanticus]SHH54925.1 4-hydroxy-tetrahydrodipicolinate synthase [Thermosipho atlanticus DSM 15807]